jgi:formylglycine-generating enzyme required for sulfatase activity
MKALVKDREQRYASALDFSRELARAAQSSAPGESPEVLPPPKKVSPPPPEVTPPPPPVKITPPPQPAKGEPLPPESQGAARVHPQDGLKYVWIPPGSFRMGASPGDPECRPDEKPPHQVTITRGFWLAQTSVTVGAYKRFAAATQKAMPLAPDFNPNWSKDQMPMVNVTWNDARAYCEWAGGWLPSEAEWEYAARGGNTEARYGPLDEVAWYNLNSGKQTNLVGQKRANGFGLYDMLGNVWEWVMDWYDEEYYKYNLPQDPAGPASGEFRILRGGSWVNDPWIVRASYRFRDKPVNWYDDLGFRCAREEFPS